jgi:ABC-type transport system involved in multi-copper enzyme maturation permease subunit
MFTGGNYTDPGTGNVTPIMGIFGGGQDTTALLGLFIFMILFILTAMWGLGILIGSVAIIPSIFVLIGYIPQFTIVVAIILGLLFGLGLNRFVRR